MTFREYLKDQLMNHPQRTTGLFQTIFGSIMGGLSGLGLSPRVLGFCIMIFGIAQATFGWIYSHRNDPD